MSGEEFLLKWNDHHNSFFSIMQDLCSSDTLTDVTLACGGQLFEAHKLMLCVCSSFFRSILARPGRPDRANQHPIVYLKDVAPHHLEQLMQYMYHGEINVLQEDLAPLIEAARCLQIKGLSDAPAPPPQQQQQQPPLPQRHNLPPPNLRAPPSLAHPPPMKKAARPNHHGGLQNHQKKKSQLESPLTKPPAPPALPQHPQFSLPTEPDPPESLMKDEEEMWAAAQHGGGQPGMDPEGDYGDMNHEMYQDQDLQQGEEDMYGSQVRPLVESAGISLTTTIQWFLVVSLTAARIMGMLTDKDRSIII